MGRQLRTKRAGEAVAFVAATTGSTAPTISNYGVSELTSTAANTYVLDAPAAGIRKVLVDRTPTSAAVVVRGSTGTSVIFGTTAATQITFNSTKEAAVELLGRDSTSWIVLNVYPDNVAANTTGTVIGTS